MSGSPDAEISEGAQTPLHASARAALVALEPHTSADDSLRHTMLAFLDSNPNGCLRENAAGHITASALVLDHDGCHVLLTLHPRVGMWVQLGGHCEPGDASIRDAALREATEESGIEGLEISPDLLSIHTHPITCSLGVPTRHLDLRYLVRAPIGARPVRSSESLDLRWWPVDNLPANADSEAVGAMISAARRRR